MFDPVCKICDRLSDFSAVNSSMIAMRVGQEKKFLSYDSLGGNRTGMLKNLRKWLNETAPPSPPLPSPIS